MFRFAKVALKFSILSLLSGCVIGQVLFTDGTPYTGAVVSLRDCETCAPTWLSTDENGYFAYDPYSEPGPLFVDAGDGIIVTVHADEWMESSSTCTRTTEVQVAHRTEFSTYVQPDGTEVYYTLVPPIYISRVSSTATPGPTSCASEDYWLDLAQNWNDQDNDGLPLSVEDIYGTDDHFSDVDSDGLSDSLELYGMHSAGTPSNRSWEAASDIRSRGASPTRKDVFVEVDYWEGTSGTMRPGADLLNMIDAHYGGLDDIGNPDLSTGMDVVLVIDEEDASLTACDSLSQAERFQYRTARREGVFTFGLFCCCGNGGAAPIPGSQFFVRGRTDFNESNDMTEEAQNELFSSILHEFGHALGLRHGGFSGGHNCKPNYPSDMNYAYFPAFGIDGNYYTLATSRSQYSSGSLADIVEETVSEFDPLGAPYGSISFLEVFGGTTASRYLTFVSSHGNTDVDWNHNGFANGGPPDVPVRTGGDPGCTDTTFRTIKDNNDAQTVLGFLDDPGRLAQPGSGAGGAWSEAGNAEMICGLQESADSGTTLRDARPWLHADARRQLQEVTGLAGEDLQSWAREAGFDVTDRREMIRLEELLRASARGRSAEKLLATLDYGRSTRWLSREKAEKEVLQRGGRLLEEALGKRVDLSFVDCAMSPEEARAIRDRFPQGATLAQEVDGSLDTIQLCR